MKTCHSVIISVYCKPEEDENTILDKLERLVPFKLENQLHREKVSTFFDRKILVVTASIVKQKEITEFIDHLTHILTSEQQELLINQAESRLDDNLNFFLRLDKKKLVFEDKYWITDGGDCIHIKMNLASYPKKREKGLEIVRAIFGQTNI
jgi:RNA-binding protein